MGHGLFYRNPTGDIREQLQPLCALRVPVTQLEPSRAAHSLQDTLETLRDTLYEKVGNPTEKNVVGYIGSHPDNPIVEELRGIVGGERGLGRTLCRAMLPNQVFNAIVQVPTRPRPYAY